MCDSLPKNECCEVVDLDTHVIGGKMKINYCPKSGESILHTKSTIFFRFFSPAINLDFLYSYNAIIPKRSKEPTLVFFKT